MVIVILRIMLGPYKVITHSIQTLLQYTVRLTVTFYLKAQKVWHYYMYNIILTVA